MIRKVQAGWSLLRQYGLRRGLFRLSYDLRRQTGLLKRRLPAWRWQDRPLATWLDPSVAAEPEAYRAYRDRAAPAFFFEAGRPPAVPGDWTRDAVEDADAVLAGRFRYFSDQVVRLGYPDPDWLLNPLTGRRASADRHWTEVATHDPAIGDIKFVWEPSRFAWAYALVRAYASTGDERYPEAFWRLLASWMAANPPQRGPNWYCGQEIAIRAMACVFALYAFWGSEASTPARVADLVVLLAASCDRIVPNINYARAQMGNHAVSEAAGLYTVGLLWPELRGAGRWRRLGRWVLEDEARRFNWADGSYTQHSMNYQRLMLHDYLWCLRLADLHGEAFSDRTRDRLRASYAFLYQHQDSATGRVPNYGPNDGALILPLNGCDYLDYRPVLGAMHTLLAGERLYETGPWVEDLVWLFGPEALETPHRLLPRGSRDFSVGGYHTLRGKASWAMVRCHTYRNRPNQADMLHLDLWWRGRNLLRDSGSYLYFDPDEGWDRYFVSTAAHNTVQVAGEDQMVKGPRFQWHSLVASRWFGHWRHGSMELWQGEHDGYRRLPCRAVHRRTVCRLGEAYWLIVDDVLGRGRERVRLLWHLADVPAELVGETVRLEPEAGPAELAVWSTAAVHRRLERGLANDERLGWQALSYGRRTPAPALCAEAEGPLPVRFVTLLNLAGGPLEVAEFDPLGRIAWTADGWSEASVLLVPPAEGPRVVGALSFAPDGEWTPPDPEAGPMHDRKEDAAP